MNISDEPCGPGGPGGPGGPEKKVSKTKQGKLHETQQAMAVRCVGLSAYSTSKFTLLSLT